MPCCADVRIEMQKPPCPPGCDMPCCAGKAHGVPEGVAGALVTDVVSSGPATDSGIRKGFVIVGYEGSPVRSADDLIELIRRSRPGRPRSPEGPPVLPGPPL